jgi:hypothetical protein
MGSTKPLLTYAAPSKHRRDLVGAADAIENTRSDKIGAHSDRKHISANGTILHFPPVSIENYSPSEQCTSPAEVNCPDKAKQCIDGCGRWIVSVL